ncbi:MAG: hypothetical protein AMJ46_12500 [Latescibacteria bacterium DG_63]|nr:MAG: hypothetical protein AMJ46_12500 [Latescibacteria bacterium DG_63]
MGSRYAVRLSENFTEALEEAAKELGVGKSEALRRALMLLRHAAKADSVEIRSHGKNGQIVRREILIK